MRHHLIDQGQSDCIVLALDWLSKGKRHAMMKHHPSFPHDAK